MNPKVALFAFALLAAGCPAPPHNPDGGLLDCGAGGYCQTGVCDRRLNHCVGCRNSADCTAGQLCTGGSCVDAVGCTIDSDCTAKGLLCDPVLGRCIQCRTFAECDAGQACLGTSCADVTACTATTDCQSGLQQCLTATVPRYPTSFTKACQDCAAFGDCTGGVTCFEGICGGDPCIQGSRCSGDGAASPNDIASCEAHREATSSRCYSASFLLSNCLLNQQTCGSDRRTNLDATLARCSDQSTAYNSCVNPP